MGKLRKGRRQQRHNPLARKGEDKGKLSLKDQNTRTNKIAPLVARLSASATNDRALALSAITILAEDAKMRELLLKEKLVATVVEKTLVDESDELIVELFGLLRNLTIEEGHDVAKHLWRLEIWKHIEDSISKIEKSFDFMSSSKLVDKKRVHMLFDFTENLLSLVVAIASCSEELYNNVYERIDRVFGVVATLLSWNYPQLKVSLKLFNALLEFVYEFASESADFVTKLSTSQVLSLDSLASSLNDDTHASNTLGKALMQGILFHVYEVTESNAAEKQVVCARFLDRLFANLDGLSLESISTQLASKDNAQEPIQKLQNSEEKPQDIDMPFGGQSAEKTAARSDLNAIDVTVDLVASVCEYLSVNESDPDTAVSLGPDILGILINTACSSFLELLLFDHNLPLGVLAKVLVALNNVAWLFVTCETVPVQWFTAAHSLWPEVLKTAQLDDLEVQQLCSNVLWALAKVLGPDVSAVASQDLVKGLVLKALEVAKAPETSELAADFLVSAAGLLGTLAMGFGTVEAAEAAGNFLLEASEFSSHSKLPKSAEVVAVALDTFFDLFSDADFPYDEPVFVAKGYIQRLEQLEPLVKENFKRVDKVRFPNEWARAEDAFNTLVRFIAYKKSERA